MKMASQTGKRGQEERKLGEVIRKGLPAFAFFAFITLWVSYCLFVSSRLASPGLLDDGSHMAGTFEYIKNGWWKTIEEIIRRINDSTDHYRFYEAQRSLLYFYYLICGFNVKIWYAFNFAIVFFTAWTVYSTCNFLGAGIGPSRIGFVAVLTCSPLVDAARANFGKVEILMLSCFCVALRIAVSLSLRKNGSESGYVHFLAKVMAFFAFILVCSISKESGKLFSLDLAALCVLLCALFIFARAQKTERQQSIVRMDGVFSVAVLSLVAFLISSYVFRSSRGGTYIQSYFTLNYTPKFMLNSLKVYFYQNSDIFAMGIMAMLCLILSLNKINARIIVAFCVFSLGLVYITLLLMFRFQVSYYAYPTAVCWALSLSLGLGSRHLLGKSIFITCLLLTRFVTVPELLIEERAQRYVDNMSFLAQHLSADLGFRRLIALDLSEEQQPVQEWNFLRRLFLNGRIPPLFGGAPDFSITKYQQEIRSATNLEQQSSGDLYASGSKEQENSIPQVGDGVTFRVGAIGSEALQLRNVMPFAASSDLYLANIDQTALRLVGDTANYNDQNQTFWPFPGKLKESWLFYKVVTQPGFVLLGREPDGWLKESAYFIASEAAVGRSIKMRLELAGLPFHYPFTIRALLDRVVVASSAVDHPGILELDIPVHKAGRIDIVSSEYIAPASVNSQGDTRKLSVRLLGTMLSAVP